MLVYAEIIGGLAAVITTLGWLPQAAKIIREKRAEGVSLAAYGALSLGVFLWLVYGVLLGSLPLIGANAITLSLTGLIVGLKLRYG